MNEEEKKAILAAWPHDEDGVPLAFGDEVEAMYGLRFTFHSFTVCSDGTMVVSDERFVDGERIRTTVMACNVGEPVKRWEGSTLGFKEGVM